METAGLKQAVSSVVIEELNEIFSHILTEGFMGMMIECCVMSLHVCNHQSGETKLIPHISGANLIENPKVLFWEKRVDDAMMNTHKDESRTTDYGSMCMSLLLLHEIINGKYLWTTSSKGDGVDFWLSDPKTFSPVARLEISGIRKATPKNNIQSRLNTKIKQTRSSDSSNVPAYVSIVEFSKPTAIVVQP